MIVGSSLWGRPEPPLEFRFPLCSLEGHRLSVLHSHLTSASGPSRLQGGAVEQELPNRVKLAPRAASWQAEASQSVALEEEGSFGVMQPWDGPSARLRVAFGGQAGFRVTRGRASVRSYVYIRPFSAPE